MLADMHDKAHIHTYSGDPHRLTSHLLGGGVTWTPELWVRVRKTWPEVMAQAPSSVQPPARGPWLPSWGTPCPQLKQRPRRHPLWYGTNPISRQKLLLSTLRMKTFFRTCGCQWGRILRQVFFPKNIKNYNKYTEWTFSCPNIYIHPTYKYT